MIEAAASEMSNMNVAIITATITATVTFIGILLNNRANNIRLKLQLDHDSEKFGIKQKIDIEKIRLEHNHERNLRDREFRINRIEEVYGLIEEFILCRVTIFRHFKIVIETG